MAFTFKLEHPDGTPADPPTIRSAVPNWEIGDQIPRDLTSRHLSWSDFARSTTPNSTHSWSSRTPRDGPGG
jgi:hypothetical protein